MPQPIRPDPTKVQVYWRPGCPYCTHLRRQLRRTGLAYELVDIWKDESGAAYVRSVNGGNETVPTVAVAGAALTNPSARQVMDLVRQRAPHLQQNPHAGDAEEPGTRPAHKGLALGLLLGVLGGVVLGLFLGGIGLGVALGVELGAAIGFAVDRRSRHSSPNGPSGTS